MRIVAGKNKGKKLLNASKLSLRPTTDSNRENIFNLISHTKAIKDIGFDIKKAHMLDIFAGTGAVSLEALSRGALSATLIEINKSHIELAKRNAQKLNIENIEFIQKDFFTKFTLEKNKYNLVFIDPPYNLKSTKRILEKLISENLIRENSLIIIEHCKSEILENIVELDMIMQKKYGISTFSYFTNPKEINLN